MIPYGPSSGSAEPESDPESDEGAPAGAARTGPVRQTALDQTLAAMNLLANEIERLNHAIRRYAEQTQRMAADAGQAAARIGAEGPAPGAAPDAEPCIEVCRVAGSLVVALRNDPSLCSGEPARQARALRQAIERHPMIESAWAADPNGAPIARTVARVAAPEGADGDSEPTLVAPRLRPLAGSDGVHLSASYRSAASGAFCVTVASSFRGPDGAPGGVVALQVNIRETLAWLEG